MAKKSNKRGALKYSKGVDQPDSLNPEAIARLKSARKKLRSLEEYIAGVRSGNRTILGQAITLVESAHPRHQELASGIINACLPGAGNSIRLGITGIPGVGKSTFIEVLGNQIIEGGKKLAVLAIDPTSERSSGSILGDKTRMESLSSNPGAFIRPSPSGGSLGGVARKTREAVVLCEAAGYEVIFIETVGVGQSETAVQSMVDCFLLLMLAGAGDELQGIKRGIMEMADIVAITKADGDNKARAGRAKSELEYALHLFPPPPSGWTPKVLTCSALKNEGVDTLWKLVNDHIDHTRNNGYFTKHRQDQRIYWLHSSIAEHLKSRFYRDESIQQELKKLEEQVRDNTMTSFQAAQILLDKYYK